jgi:hypothetical protein
MTSLIKDQVAAVIREVRDVSEKVAVQAAQLRSSS